MTLDDPRRGQDPDSPPREPAPDVGIRPDGYLTEASFAEPVPAPDAAAPRNVSPGGTDEPVREDADGEPEPVKLVIRDRRRLLGIVAFVLAALLFAANVVGIVLSNSGSDDVALSIAYVTIFGTILTFLGGLLAAALNLGRGWGIAAVVLSVLANPFVLVVLLGTFTGAIL
ncbi:hypothetical protein ACFFGH_19420 [Lysobacter korlensis]|uniref:Uncharacterized protein n=1 Tax=Lysobacter korlensis TaxID=553636 RepID=A0ABV6RSQ3_9GAMM